MAKRGGDDSRGLAVVAGVAALLAVSLIGWRGLQRLDRALGERLSPLVPRLDQGANRMEPAPAEASRRGPDPDRVYAIRTDGSPSRGKPDAPVTIAEFADFQ
jgi:protein-disulfide isomerase